MWPLPGPRAVFAYGDVVSTYEKVVVLGSDGASSINMPCTAIFADEKLFHAA
jgi:hypothetical protein